MNPRFSLVAVSVCILIFGPCFVATRAAEPDSFIKFTANDWPWWRGVNRNGIASPDQSPPTSWSETKNVVWKTPLPGRGHSSPTVVGDHVYIATAESDRETQSLLCFDRRTGEQIWQTDVHKGGLMMKNAKSSAASSTVACDGERLFVNFPNSGALVTTALSLEGKVLWRQKISDYKVHQGYGGSPAIYGPLVIVASDNKLGGAVVGLNRKTGDVVWSNPRPKKPNYASPVILRVNGSDQLFLTGGDFVSSFDPLTGKKLWEIAGATTECVTTTVTDGERIFSTGGYPKNHVAAISANNNGKIVWENKTRVYVPSMVFTHGHLFAIADAGVAMCIDSATGKELWKARLGGTFSSSPVVVGDHIYVTDESGKTTIFKADASEFKLVGENTISGEVFATPTIVGGKIYHRVARKKEGRREEYLYCIGKK